jgi:hypothetical protein
MENDAAADGAVETGESRRKVDHSGIMSIRRRACGSVLGRQGDRSAVPRT